MPRTASPSGACASITITSLVTTLIGTGPIGCEREAPRTAGRADHGGAPWTAPALTTKHEPSSDATVRFVDMTAYAGLDFQHDAGARGAFAFPELTGAGVGFLDYDNDGDPDLYLVQSGPLPGDEGTRPANRLCRNDGAWNFTDVTEASGTGDRGYGMGVACADYDNDGDADLYVTNVGANVLYRNDGDGTFTEVGAAAGVDDEAFGLSAAFFDYDRDGWLDLYVTNYVQWAPGVDPACYTAGGLRDYCDPGRYPGAPDRLYRNQADGTFSDVSEEQGIAAVDARSMGVVAADFDGDGWQDVYVAVDGGANLLWMNQGGAGFIERAFPAGCAVNASGVMEASMGIACEDLDDDGDFDLLTTHLRGETNTLYRNEGGRFVDATASAGLAAWSRPDTAFGTGFFDADRDGWLDVFIANGAVAAEPAPARPDHLYAQPDRFARGGPDGFTEASSAIAAAVPTIEMSRGVAFADVDADGRVDLAVSSNRGAVRLLRNAAPAPHHGIAFRLVGTRDNRDAIGATITLVDDPRHRTRSLRPHSSFLSSSEPVVHFGLGTRSEPVSGAVRWPDGTVEPFEDLDVDAEHRLTQGAGAVLAARWDTGSLAPDDASVTAPRPAPRRPMSADADIEALASFLRRHDLPALPEDVHPGVVARLLASAEAVEGDPSAAMFADLAMVCDGNGLAAQAIALYERAVALDANRYEWWHLLGRARMATDDVAGAIESFRRSLALRDDFAPACARLGELYLDRGAFGEAERCFDRYRTVRPADPLGLEGLARVAAQRGDWSDVRDLLSESLRLDDRNQAAHLLLAQAHRRLGDVSQAKETERAARALPPRTRPPLRDDVQTAMLAHSRSTSYLDALVRSLVAAGDIETAYETALEVQERRSGDADNCLRLAELALRLGRVDDALAHADRAIELRPASPHGHATRATLLLRVRRPEASLAACDAGIDVAPYDGNLRIIRGMALAALGRQEDAIDAFDAGLRVLPTRAGAHLHRARSLLAAGRRAEAAEAARRTLELRPGDPTARRILELTADR